LFCDDIEMPFRVLPPLVELITKDRGGDDECAADEVAAFQTNRPLKATAPPKSASAADPIIFNETFPMLPAARFRVKLAEKTAP
jgi:hypothetical protein